jgi:ABC-type protease/lipase transport system fused ATPase/permease subunit
VLDEPNSNLDSKGEAALADSIRLLKAEGVTLVAITHRLPLVSAMDKVMVLMNGTIEKFGTLAEVMPRTSQATDSATAVVAGKIGPRA